MPSPFPGMDPYLEQPSAWPNVRPITAIADDPAPQLLPKRRFHGSGQIPRVQ